MKRVLWGLAALLLLATGAGGFGVTFEARAAAANTAPWIVWFAAVVVAPLSAVGWCVYKAFRPR